VEFARLKASGVLGV